MTTKKDTTKKPATKKPKTKATDVPADTLSVADVAREMGIDPKAARAALRRSGRGTAGERYPRMVRGGDDHTKLMLFLEGNVDGVDSSTEK